MKKSVSILCSLALAVFAAALFAHTGPASAQVAGYYIGPAWSISDCTGHTGLGAPPCIAGSVTGSVTFAGVSSTFSGTVTASQVSSYALHAAGVPSMSALSDLDPSTYFSVTSGQITSTPNFEAVTTIPGATPNGE